MSYWADSIGYLAYGLLLYALPRLSHPDPKIQLRGWRMEFLATLFCILLGILTALTSVIIFNTIFAIQCLRTIRRLRNAQ